MKIAVWFVGAPCAGKSYYAKKLSESLNRRWIPLDTVEDRVKIDKMTRGQGYDNLFKNLNDDLIIVDGIVPFNFPVEMDIVQGKLKDYKIIYAIIFPEYRKFQENLLKRRDDFPEIKFEIFRNEDYLNYYDKLDEKIKKLNGVTKLVYKNSDLLRLEEDMRNMSYQHDGFTDVKFKQLKVPCENKTVLDMGCSSAQFQPMIMELGAKSYNGIDINLCHLFNDKVKYFDINYLDKFNDKYDVTICSSVMHYIHDKENFIKECARITKEICILEIPLDSLPGKSVNVGSRGLYFPTKDMFEEWVSKYFKSFKCLGKSIVEDGSYRLIYHCFK